MIRYGPTVPPVVRQTTFAWRHRLLLILGGIIGCMALGAAVARWILLPSMARADWRNRVHQAEVICEQMLDAKMAELSEQYPDSVCSRGLGSGPGSFEISGEVEDQDACYLSVTIIAPELKSCQLVQPDVLIISSGGEHTREFAHDIRRELRQIPVDVKLVENP